MILRGGCVASDDVRIPGADSLLTTSKRHWSGHVVEDVEYSVHAGSIGWSFRLVLSLDFPKKVSGRRASR